MRAGAIGLLLLLAVGAIALVIRDRQEGARADEARRLALVRQALEETVGGDVGAVEGLAALLDAPGRVDAPGFAAVAGSLLDRRPSLDAVLYASADPAERAPIAYAATRPDSAVPGPPGTDLGAEPNRHEAIRRARDTGVVQSSRAISVLGGSGRAVAVVAPVYGPGVRPATVAARRAAVKGFAVGIVRLESLETAVRRALPPGLRYAVADASTTTPLLTVHPGPHAPARILEVAGRPWELSVSRADRGIPVAAYAIGLVALALAGLLLGLFRGHRPAPAPAAGRAWRAAMVRLRRGV